MLNESAIPKRHKTWAAPPELPAEDVLRILREKIAVSVRIASIALDRSPSSIYNDINLGTVPAVGGGRGKKVPSNFVLDKLGLKAA